MPTFEIVLAMQKMSDTALRAALKRSAEYIFSVGGTLRKMENLGERNLPYKIVSKGQSHRVAHFFIFSFDSGMDKPLEVRKKFSVDVDILRTTFWMKHENPTEMYVEKEKEECTQEIDLLPPPYRPNVVALKEIIEKKKKKKHVNFKNTEDTDFLI